MTDILIGYGGLAVSFSLFAIVILVILIKANNINWKFKLLAIPLMLAWGFVTYYIPVNFMGFASPQVEGVGQVVIRDFYIVEGKGFYFTVMDFNKVNVQNMFAKPGDAIDAQAPRLYVVPYDEELHKALLSIKNERRKKRRGMIVTNLGAFFDLEALLKQQKRPFELVDPAQIMTKAEREAQEEQQNQQ